MAGGPPAPSPKALDLHRRSIVVDALNVSRWHEPVYRALRDAGCTAVNATVTVRHGFGETVELIAGWLRDFERYNARNLVGDGFLEPEDAGLSSFGREVVGELNRLGILIDLSHCGYRTTMEAIELSAAPAAVTHANTRALCDTPRNKSDEQLLALAARGGVVGVTAFPTTLPEGRRTLEGVLDMVDYLVDLLGIDAVGLGLDHVEDQPREYFMTGDRFGVDLLFPEDYVPPEWPPEYPEGLRRIRDWPNLTEGLLRRGYAEADAEKVLGGNFLRLFGEVWGAPEAVLFEIGEDAE
jgi:membrane dipeptidase